jgi:hypothetical protein
MHKVGKRGTWILIFNQFYKKGKKGKKLLKKVGEGHLVGMHIGMNDVIVLSVVAIAVAVVIVQVVVHTKVVALADLLLYVVGEVL